MAVPAPAHAIEPALSSLVLFGHDVIVRMIQLHRSCLPDMLRLVTVADDPPQRGATDPPPASYLPGLEYLGDPDLHEARIRESSASTHDCDFRSIHEVSLAGFVAVLTSVLTYDRRLIALLDRIRSGGYLRVTLDRLLGGGHGEALQSQAIEALHVHGLLFLLLLHLFPGRTRERLLIAAFRQLTGAGPTAATAAPPSSLTPSSITSLSALTSTATAVDLVQQQALQKDGSSKGGLASSRASLEPPQNKRAGSRASASLSAATAAALSSNMDRLCLACRAPRGGSTAKGAEITSIFGTGGKAGKAVSQAEHGPFPLLTCSPVIGVSSGEAEFLSSCCPLPRDAVAPAIAAMMRMGEAAAELASTWTARQPLPPQHADTSRVGKSHAGVPSTGVKGSVSSAAAVAESEGGRMDGGEVEAVAIASACAPATSRLSVLLLYQQETLSSDAEFMHAFVRNLLSFSPPPLPKPKTWSLISSPPSDSQPVDNRPSAPSWMVPVGLGFVLDLVVTWQGFPAASSALGKHLSGGLVSETAARLAVGVSGLRRSVKRTYMWLKEEAEEEEEGGRGGHEDGDEEGEEGSLDERPTGHEAEQAKRGRELRGPTESSADSVESEGRGEGTSQQNQQHHSSTTSQASERAAGKQGGERKGGRVRGLPVLRETRRVLSLIRSSHAVCRWLLLHRSASLPPLRQAVVAADASLTSAFANLGSGSGSGSGSGGGSGGGGSTGGGHSLSSLDSAFPYLSPASTAGQKDSQQWFAAVNAGQQVPAAHAPGSQAAQARGAVNGTGEGLRAILCLLLEASKLSVLASEQLRVLVARRADSWQHLAGTAAAQLATVAAELDGWRGRRVGGGSVASEERGIGREERGGESDVSHSGPQQWRPSTGESVSQWFMRLSHLMSSWQDVNAPDLPSRLQHLLLALSDASSFHQLQSDPRAAQSLAATWATVSDLAHVQSVQDAEVAELALAADVSYLWAVLPACLPVLQQHVQLVPTAIGQAGVILAKMEGSAVSFVQHRNDKAEWRDNRRSNVDGGGGRGRGSGVQFTVSRIRRDGGSTGSMASGKEASEAMSYYLSRLRIYQQSVVAVIHPAVFTVLQRALPFVPLPPSTHSHSAISPATPGPAQLAQGHGHTTNAATATPMPYASGGMSSLPEEPGLLVSSETSRASLLRARLVVRSFTEGLARMDATLQLGAPMGREEQEGREEREGKRGEQQHAQAQGDTPQMHGLSLNSVHGIRATHCGAQQQFACGLQRLLNEQAAAILSSGFSDLAGRVVRALAAEQRIPIGTSGLRWLWAVEDKADSASSWAFWGGGKTAVDREAEGGIGVIVDLGLQQLMGMLTQWHACLLLFGDVLGRGSVGGQVAASAMWQQAVAAAVRQAMAIEVREPKVRGTQHGGSSVRTSGKAGEERKGSLSQGSALPVSSAQQKKKLLAAGDRAVHHPPTFLHHTVSILLLLSDPSSSLFLRPLTAWFDAHGTSTLSLHTLRQLSGDFPGGSAVAEAVASLLALRLQHLVRQVGRVLHQVEQRCGDALQSLMDVLLGQGLGLSALPSDEPRLLGDLFSGTDTLRITQGYTRESTMITTAVQASQGTSVALGSIIGAITAVDAAAADILASATASSQHGGSGSTRSPGSHQGRSVDASRMRGLETVCAQGSSSIFIAGASAAAVVELLASPLAAVGQHLLLLHAFRTFVLPLATDAISSKAEKVHLPAMVSSNDGVMKAVCVLAVVTLSLLPRFAVDSHLACLTARPISRALTQGVLLRAVTQKNNQIAGTSTITLGQLALLHSMSASGYKSFVQLLLSCADVEKSRAFRETIIPRGGKAVDEKGKDEYAGAAEWLWEMNQVKHVVDQIIS